MANTQRLVYQAEGHANNRPPMRRTLHSWQIFFIVIGGIIGAGFFVGSSLALSVAGPGGALLAFALVGTVAIAVMEGICEMIVLWPVPNAMVEFVRAFVDEELAKVIGVGYWYTYSVSFSALVIGAINLADYWDLSKTWKAVLFVLTPIVLAAINTRPVEVFGWIELAAGAIKVVLLVGLFLLMVCINLGAGPKGPINSTFFNDGIQNNPNDSSGRFAAIAQAIPLATFSYLGVEMVTMTAFEARRPSQDLHMPARNVAWVITVIYILTTFAFVLNVSWKDKDLPDYYNQVFGGLIRGTDRSDPANPQTYSAPVIAVREAMLHAGPVTACLIYSTISAANIALYAASRALYGLVRDIRLDRESPWWLRGLAAPASLELDTGSPWWAITLSVLLLCWLPFISLPKRLSSTELQETLINIGSVSGVLVWSSQCLAYICFYHWRRKHERKLTGDYYRKFRQTSKASHFAFFQPAIAWFGLVSTLMIGIVFNSASMWNGKGLGWKFASAYISPIFFLVLWLALKYFKIRRQPHSKWVGVDLSDPKNFKNRLQHLNDLIYPGDGSPLEEDENEDMQPQDGLLMTGYTDQNAGTPPRYSSSGVPMQGQTDDEDEDEPPGEFLPVVTNGSARPPGRDPEPSSIRQRRSENEEEIQGNPPQTPPAIHITRVETMPAFK